jgi:cobalt-zinc-cadmium efflux system protein
MGHEHNHAPSDFGRAFAVGIALNLTFVVIEFLYGIWGNSLSLIADAGHNLSDVLGLALAWGAIWLAKRQTTEKRTYGYRRSTILAALVNAVMLLVAVGIVAWEAVHRFFAPAVAVNSSSMIWIAAIGILVNAFSAYLFMAGSKEDLNVRGAFAHLAADAVVSLGVVLTGVVIAYTGWWMLDPTVSLVISAVIVWGTWSLLRDSVNLALDAVPEGIDLQQVREYLLGLTDCRDVHDLHVWAMSTTENALTAHIVIPNLMMGDALIKQTSKELHERFGIEHATLQIEYGDDAGCRCGLDKPVSEHKETSG